MFMLLVRSFPNHQAKIALFLHTKGIVHEKYPFKLPKVSFSLKNFEKKSTFGWIMVIFASEPKF